MVAFWGRPESGVTPLAHDGRMTNGDRRIAAIATGQLGAFTRMQATHAGLSDRQLRSRVQSGTLIQTGPNAFRVAGTPSTRESDLRALVLDVGPPVWVAGPTAAALHGYDGYQLRRPFHLLMPDSRNVRRTGAVIHRSASIDLIDRATNRGFPVTSGVRTVIDLARTASPDELAVLIENVLLLGLSNEDLLYRRIGKLRQRGRFGMPALLEALDRRAVLGGTESWLEREYLRLLDQAGIMRPLTQQVLTRAGDRTVRVDCRFPGTDVVVELLGYQYHRSRDQMNRDTARLNALVADGFAPYQFTYDQVVNRPDGVIAETYAALLRSFEAA